MANEWHQSSSWQKPTTSTSAATIRDWARCVAKTIRHSISGMVFGLCPSLLLTITQWLYRVLYEYTPASVFVCLCLCVCTVACLPLLVNALSREGNNATPCNWHSWIGKQRRFCPWRSRWKIISRAGAYILLLCCVDGGEIWTQHLYQLKVGCFSRMWQYKQTNNNLLFWFTVYTVNGGRFG